MNKLFEWVKYKVGRAYYWYIQEPKLEKERVKLREKTEYSYEEWITAVEENYDKIDLDSLEYKPKISVIVPVYNVLDKHLIPCIESVINQEYTNWELCLADDCSTWENVHLTLKKYENHPNIKIVYRVRNGHISECTNSALQLATGEYVSFLDCDDILAPFALSEVVKMLNEDPTLDYIYSDEDKVDDDGENRHMPHFKSDWAPDTLMSNMYTCHFSTYRKKIVDELGGIRKGYEGAQDYDFTLRFTEKTNRIGHISKILYHWRERKESTAGNAEAKSYVIEAAKKSKQDALARRGVEANLELVEQGYQFNVNYRWKQYPRVSIIIPSKDNYDILKQCITSLYMVTDYCEYEVIVVDNGSDEKNRELYSELLKEHGATYIYEKKDFNFSYMCNLGVSHSTGEYVLLLNDDIEIMQPDWITRMVGQAMLPYTGAVGAKLLYPDRKTIQHVGVIIVDDGPVHAFNGLDDNNAYYFLRNRINYNWIAVTAACLMVSRKKYDEVMGLYEGLAVAYNDVDFCFKLVEKGYYNIVRNDVVLIHHESVSRGHDYVDDAKMERLNKEREALYKRHPQFRGWDPFYNKNLARHRSDFSCETTIGNVGVIYNKICKANDQNYKTNGIVYAIDAIEEYKRYAYIRGWMFVADVYASDIWKTYVILKNTQTGELYECETRKEQRLDVQEAVKEYGHFEFTGFDCTVRKESIPNGEYEIILRMEDYAIDTNKTIIIQESEEEKNGKDKGDR